MVTFSAAANIGRKLNIDLVKLSTSGTETVLGGLLKTKSSSKHVEVFSRSALVQLNQGDQLFIKQAAGAQNGVYSDWEKQTSFAGFLVYPDVTSNPPSRQTEQSSRAGFEMNQNQQISPNTNSTPLNQPQKLQDPLRKYQQSNVNQAKQKEESVPDLDSQSLKNWFKYLYSGLKEIGEPFVDKKADFGVQTAHQNPDKNWKSKDGEKAREFFRDQKKTDLWEDWEKQKLMMNIHLDVTWVLRTEFSTY